MIIDPSGQAIAWVMKEYADKKLNKSSFIDPKFPKILETGLRFGTPILVQDVEKVDPILNSILNRETHKENGRVLVTVGDQDIDFSPSFEMFLTTRDSTAVFTPDLCSRVTFVNFTVTSSSLQNQAMNLALKSERPDIEAKRQNMIKLQGEFKVL
jgi:dynein heavy chain 1, cytosolic